MWSPTALPGAPTGHKKVVMQGVAPNRQTPSDEESRFAEIYNEYGKLLHAYCARRTLASQSADAVAEVFLVAWKKIDQVPRGAAALPWLYGVAYRVISHQWRSKARSRRLVTRLGGLAQIEAATPELLLIRREEDQFVMKAASRLRSIDQEILRLTLWEDLALADVALVLDLAPAVIKQRAYRARRALAVEYQKLTNDQPPAARKAGRS
jgi:RNA polymerase sigma-70 factor (ECF subfamily)